MDHAAPHIPIGKASWRIVNDGVMGGLSRGRVSAGASGLLFEGDVSLANGGGFASVRTAIPETDLSTWDGLELHADSGGKTFQLRLRTDEEWDGVAYRATFRLPSGAAGVVRLPWSAFRATWRGREQPEAAPLDPSRIAQVGFLISGGQDGAFRLQVDWIRAYRGTERASR
ncbi:CIA30 family protein [bacterium]|nr:CIA30 family protein [bacterium]